VKLKIVLLSILFTFCFCSAKWVFSDPPSTIAITQRLVVEKIEPVLFVLHDEDGEWQFLANAKQEEFVHQVDQIYEITLGDLVALDSSLTQVAKLQKGWKAIRIDSKSHWKISKYK
jgi:hypothetical protein